MRMRQQSMIVIAIELNGRPLPGADAGQFPHECENRTARFAPTRSVVSGPTSAGPTSIRHDLQLTK